MKPNLRARKPFKNTLCLKRPPEWWETRPPGFHYRNCIRHADHPGPHRTRLCEWSDGEKESHLRD